MNDFVDISPLTNSSSARHLTAGGDMHAPVAQGWCQRQRQLRTGREVFL